MRTPLSFQIATRSEVDGRRIGMREFWPYLEDLAAVDPRVFVRFAHALSEHSASPYLDRVDVPVQIVAGGRDTFTPVWRSVEMHRRIPDSELIVLDEGTHTAPIEAPALTGQRLRRFLQRFPAA